MLRRVPSPAPEVRTDFARALPTGAVPARSSWNVGEQVRLLMEGILLASVYEHPAFPALEGAWWNAWIALSWQMRAVGWRKRP